MYFSFLIESFSQNKVESLRLPLSCDYHLNSVIVPLVQTHLGKYFPKLNSKLSQNNFKDIMVETKLTALIWKDIFLWSTYLTFLFFREVFDCKKSPTDGFVWKHQDLLHNNDRHGHHPTRLESFIYLHFKIIEPGVGYRQRRTSSLSPGSNPLLLPIHFLQTSPIQYYHFVKSFFSCRDF